MKKYIPSNGTEGLAFESCYCEKCEKDKDGRLTMEGGCNILLRAYTNNIDDKDYPTEWIYSDNGIPTCTAFEEIK